MLNCYYSILGVDQKASLDDIKKAYKRLALIYHPDKNNNSKEATERFSLIQAAYEVLSDNSERRWYDTHREEIFRQNSRTGSERSTFTAITVEVRILLLSSFFYISHYFNEIQGFYTKIRNLFQRIASEELAYADEQVNIEKLPPFGHGKSPYIPTVRDFYEKWSCFSTLKSFSWVDQYKYRNSERKAKRIMEKENSKLRKIAIKEFNDAVKSLVNFIKKRDIRVKIEKVSETDRQASLLASSKAQAEKDRAVFQASLGVYDEQEWAKININIEVEEEEKDEEIFECIICKKSFKSEKQFIEHEKSKKHIKSVNIFKKILKKVPGNLDINNLGEEANLSDSHEEYFTGDEEVNFESDQKQDLNKQKQDNSNKDNDNSINDDQLFQSLNEELEESDIIYNSETSFLEIQDYEDDISKDIDSLSDIVDKTLTIKKENATGKNKYPKNSKTKGKKNKNTNINSNTCTFCLENFPSRNKLFDHFRRTGHSQPLPQLRRKK
ncbi:hypothetical protein T552_00214 [Pneumocystis carinii B80]|uniref:J domain-containing protein n=1 Tax=Pneumocystis carinii (strain B80) TaxID=1408658 RepID=A0A0W4ZT86_PNEC8|nr:hypothetical protein T552_00214 [Pneumocystis carinii B80]KTW31576.1 hypothetical protein T552_00214 [Pneumocystis carinii B80]